MSFGHQRLHQYQHTSLVRLPKWAELTGANWLQARGPSGKSARHKTAINILRCGVVFSGFFVVVVV